MRFMSFALTTRQVQLRQKTVTRRLGWTGVTVGTLLQPVLQCQGLKKGERMVKIGGPIRIVAIRREQLQAITPDECVREGFQISPRWSSCACSRPRTGSGRSSVNTGRVVSASRRISSRGSSSPTRTKQ